jgi:hypothetical protein
MRESERERDEKRERERDEKREGGETGRQGGRERERENVRGRAPYVSRTFSGRTHFPRDFGYFG